MANKGQGRMLAVERRQRIIEMLENGSSVLIADICRECGETSYAVQVFTTEPDSYECVRREDLEPKYGVREKRCSIRSPVRRWA